MDALSLGFVVVLFAVCGYLVFGSMVFYFWNRLQVRRDPIGWLRARGVETGDPASVQVLWVCGRVGGQYFINLPVVATVFLAEGVYVESEVPTWFRRGRQMIPRGTVLSVTEDGTVELPGRYRALRSAPDRSVLPSLLSLWGWELCNS